MRFSILIMLLLFFSSCDESQPEADLLVADVSINDLSISEGDQETKIVLDITLSESLDQQVVIQYTTEDGTAIAKEDYYTTSGQLVFEPGDVRKMLPITILGDLTPAEDKVFYVRLSGENERIRFKKDLATITIRDDDANPGSGELVIPETGYLTPDVYDGMTLSWSDEFDGNALNTADWTYEIGTGSNGWGNNELQYYTDKNTSIVEGNLVIEARKENHGGRAYTSSRIVTRDKQEFKYGRVDIRAALPQGQGIWPALWMLGSNFTSVGWPACGEIDIMEMVGGNGRENTTHGTIHWSNANSQHQYQGGHTTLSSGIFADEFHVFSIIWDEKEIRWLMDDKQFHSESITSASHSEFHNDFFFIFNVAVGGNWPGSPTAATGFPQRMIVDYVRVFQTE